MDQKDQGSGSSSNVTPLKRKRGRPRKYQTVVQDVENLTRNQETDNPMVGNLETTDNSTAGNLETTDNSAVGSFVHGVVEGDFGAGYVVNVQLLGEPNSMRGVVFKPGQVNPVTPQNDLAPHLKMIKRTELPIPPLANTQTGLPLPGFVPNPLVSNTQAKEVRQGTEKQGDALHELDASTKVKESSAAGGVRWDSRLVKDALHEPGSVRWDSRLVKDALQTEVHGSGSSSVLDRQTEVHDSVSSSVLNRQTGSPGFVPMRVLRNRQTEVHGSGSSSVLNRQTEVHGSGSSSMLDRQTGVHGSGSSSVLNRQTRSPGFVPMPVPRNRQTEVHGSSSSSVLNRQTWVHGSGSSSVLNRQTGSPGFVPMRVDGGVTVEDTDKEELSTEQQSDTLHEPDVDTSTKVKESSADVDGEATRDYSRPVSDISLVQTNEDTDKELITEQQDDTLHELVASTKVKESGADEDGGATSDYSRPASDSISLVQTTEDTAKELITDQQAVPSVHQLNEPVHE